jgi:VanZ family protein
VLAHFAEYAVLTLLLLRALDTHDVSWRRAVRIALALAFAYAVADEFHQSFVPNRHPSATDLVVDTLGIGAVLTAAASLYRRRDVGRI